MKRREFIALFGGAAVSWPVRGHTQKIGPVIGVIGAGSHPAYSDRLRALQEALAEMSYIEHRKCCVHISLGGWANWSAT
jgi:hypothetical protein